MNQESDSGNTSFLDINWSLHSNDDLLLFPPTTTPNTQDKVDDINIINNSNNSNNETLSQIRKLYNEMYSHFINIQGLVIQGGEEFISEERVREIVSISNRYQSVILSTRDQIQKALATGHYLDYDDADTHHNPYDNDLKTKERSRISQIMEDAYQKNFSLIIFCGHVDSIYPSLCFDLSKQIGIQCKLITRNSNIFKHQSQNQSQIDKFNNDQNKMKNNLIILNRKEYSKRIEYIENNINDLENPIFIDCDLIFSKYKQEIENLNIISMILKITHLFYFSPTISPHQLLDCLKQQQDQGVIEQFEELLQDIGSVEQDQVLSFVSQMLCHGLIDESIHLLNLLSRLPKSSSSIHLKSTMSNNANLRRSPIGVMIDLLQRIPIRRKTNFTNEYIQLWQQWHQEVGQIASSGLMESSGGNGLKEMIDLLNGDEKILSKYNNNSGQTAYLQSVVTHLLYVEHVSSPQQIRQLFLHYYTKFKSASLIDRIIKSLAAPDQLQVALEEMAKHLPSWLVVHVTDLLVHHPYVLKRQPHQPSPLLSTRDQLLTSYGFGIGSRSISPRHCLWLH
ncbi:nucleoporin 85 [Cavenderia fasciculata]|uniref:Nucleoporin 85 n=1 Tax=Cavenderia fasciculata TaxID=261658 RepID=F4Q8Y0_CACFS|nr:nucleoporin 85 [Cavenderia fasciculata]EGG15149.1 nucleoporin 85 [Cavenderia fasciculata]|eukprot:XP_004351869.1 nucleoporin 85 [Cavenderia fasciculata]